MSYEQLMSDAARLAAQAEHLRQQAESEHKEQRKGNLRSWLGYSFESSSSLTPEFAEFSKQVRKELKALPGYGLVSYSRGHFEFTAFLENVSTGKLVYVSCSDVRFFRDEWFNNLLIRTAQHDKDYTGGRNQSTTWDKLKEVADQISS